jgi:hypothetical protein
MATDYTANKVSFTVTWTAQPYNNQIWVIVDYIKVQDASTAGNSWKRALVTAVARNSGTGSAATVTGQRGFWLNTAGSSGSANVTATLSLDAGVQLYNWCAYALNYPPKAELQSNGSYKLTGTPPFTVNGTTLPAGSLTVGPGTCITSLTDATDNPSADLPMLTISTSNPAARCGEGAVTLAATASGGVTSSMTYTWTVGGSAAQTTSANTYAPTVSVGGATYSITATNAAGCSSAAKTGTITVYALPTITLTTANNNQTVDADVSITPIEYTTANASGVKITGPPTGVYGSYSSNTYTVYGTPSATGTYNYTVTTTNSNGCSNATATGTITVNPNNYCLPSNLTLGTVGFTSTATYTRNGITISAPVTATFCQKTTYAGGSTGAFQADCRNNPGYVGDFFSWCMVVQYESQLCPSPWRAPTSEDYMMYANGTTTDDSENNEITVGIHDWGLGGICHADGTLGYRSTAGSYHSQTQRSKSGAYGAAMYTSSFNPLTVRSKSFASLLRCVQDAP